MNKLQENRNKIWHELIRVYIDLMSGLIGIVLNRKIYKNLLLRRTRANKNSLTFAIAILLYVILLLELVDIILRMNCIESNPAKMRWAHGQNLCNKPNNVESNTSINWAWNQIRLKPHFHEILYTCTIKWRDISFC